MTVNPQGLSAGTASRRDVVSGRLAQILAMTAGNQAQVRGVLVLHALHGRDEVAAAYEEWLDRDLARQAASAVPLTSWDQVPVAYCPVPAWTRDRYGHLCVICAEAVWQVVTVAGRDRMCKVCARREEQLAPGQVWLPRLPAVHAALGYPGLLPGEPADNHLSVTLPGWSGRTYTLGDANPFCLPGLLGLDPDHQSPPDAITGDPDAPRLEVTGRAGDGVRFQATFRFDPAPQGWRAAPYGFRFAQGTLLAPDGRTTVFTDAFDLLSAALDPAARLTADTSQAACEPVESAAGIGGTGPVASPGAVSDPQAHGTPAEAAAGSSPQAAAGPMPPPQRPMSHPSPGTGPDGGARERLGEARELTRAADNKAAGLLAATGILTASAAVLLGPDLHTSGVAGAWGRAGAVVAGAGLVTALLALLAVLVPRGGHPSRWLTGRLGPEEQVIRVCAIAQTKHRLLWVAVHALIVAVLAGGVVAAVRP
jgi:hypothetical protein